MARASTVTKLSLDRFFSIMGMHPLHANQVYVENLAVPDACGNGLVQYSWQASDRIGREDLAQAIAQAEESIERQLHFRLKPTFEIDEREQLGGGFRIPGPVKTDWGHLLALGVRGFGEVETDADVVYSDTDSDNYKETATITVASGSIIDPDELQIYYPGHFGYAEWEIRPITASIVGGVATIKCRREQLVKESLMESYSPGLVNGLNDANFLETVDVYRAYHDPSQQLQFLYIGNGCSCDGLSTCGICTLTGEFGRGIVRDNRNGLVDVLRGEWDDVAQAWAAPSCAQWRQPDRVRLWYRSGWRNQSLRRSLNDMDPLWERAVAHYAVTLLDRPLCGCETTMNLMRYWSNDLGALMSSPEGSTAYRMTTEQIGNPLGTTRGALFAWNLIKREQIGEAVWVR